MKEKLPLILLFVKILFKNQCAYDKVKLKLYEKNIGYKDFVNHKN